MEYLSQMDYLPVVAVILFFIAVALTLTFKGRKK